MLHRKFFSFYWFVIFSVSFLTNSCGTFTGNKVTEGMIVFSVTYPNSQNNMMTNLFPSEMVMKFKDDKVYSDFSTSMGLFSASAISDAKNKTLTQLVKVLNDKKGIVYSKKDVDQLISEQAKMKIEITKETKEIAGFKCKKAKVSFVDESKPGFDLYYTNELKIANSNWWTPFKEIDGVILEYEVSRYNIDMRLVAKEVKTVGIEESVFEIPKDYKMVTRKEIDEVFQNLQ